MLTHVCFWVWISSNHRCPFVLPSFVWWFNLVSLKKSQQRFAKSLPALSATTDPRPAEAGGFSMFFQTKFVMFYILSLKICLAERCNSSYFYDLSEELQVGAFFDRSIMVYEAQQRCNLHHPDGEARSSKRRFKKSGLGSGWKRPAKRPSTRPGCNELWWNVKIHSYTHVY